MTDGAVFAPFLLPGEAVRWAGRPALGVGLRAEDVIAVPFSVVWCWMVLPGLATLRDGFGFPGLLNLCFAGLGLYILAGRFAHDFWLRTRTHYAVTERRALILRGRRLTAVDLATADVVSLERQGEDGIGTVRFGGETGWQWSSRNWRLWSPVTAELIFADIADARRVFGFVELARAKAA